MGETAPLYDPAVHKPGDDSVVYIELFCSCGSVRRQRDPVSYIAPVVADWHAVHTGPGHQEASKQECITARETRREAALVAAGRGHQYQPRDYPHLTIDDQPRPWPAPAGQED